MVLCIGSEANGCIGGGFSAQVQSFGFDAKAKACAGHSQNKCSSSGFDKTWGNTNGVEETQIWTMGSTPKKFDDWGDEQGFQPVPVK